MNLKNAAEEMPVLQPGEALNLAQRLSKLFSTFITWMNSAGTVWIFALTFIVCADVVSRNLLGAPIRGVAEIVAYSIAGAVFLQLAHTLHVGRFTRAEMLIAMLDRRYPIAAGVYHLLFLVAGAAVFGLIAKGGLAKLLEAWPDLTFGVEGDFTMRVWPLRLIVMFGALMVAVKYLILASRNTHRLYRHVRARLAGSAEYAVGWAYLLLICLIAGIAFWALHADLSKAQIGALSLPLLLATIFLGIDIGVALIGIGFIGIWVMMGNPNIALNTVKLASNEYLRDYYFGVIPLFVLTGFLINESDIGKDTFDVARWIMKPIKGGLGVATVVANAIFAAITGSSIASAAVFTKIATPRMIDHGYSPKFAVGVVAGSSVLGMLIPPSLLLIVYGFIAEQSVGFLFIAAIIPGLLLAAAMAAAIVVMATFWPSFVGVPTYDDLQRENIFSASWKLLPVVSLVVLVMGGIYGGLFTPVEAGAVGAAGALIIAVAKRRLSRAKLWKVMIETGHTTVAVLFLILAANIYGRMLALSGFPQYLADLIANAQLGLGAFLGFYLALVIVLGMFLDSVSLMLIVLPLVLPIVSGLGADLIWFGIVTVIAVEMGLLTPPLGICVFVVHSTIDDARVTLNQIFAGAFPFVLIMLAVTLVLIAFPQLSLVLIK